MTEQQAGWIALIKTATVALATLIALIALVLLAWVHDGSYTNLALQALPVLILGGIGSLLGLRVTDVLGGILNNYVAAKFSGSPTPNDLPSLPPTPPIPVDAGVTSGAESQPEG